jgi:hypothetical protein
MQVRSGSLSYLCNVHKQLGIWKYSMKVLRKWSDGKYTVLFEEKQNETEMQGASYSSQSFCSAPDQTWIKCAW